MFGEMGLMLGQPRSATVLCSTPPLRGSGPEKYRKAETGGLCVVNEIKGEDFVRMLKQSESFLKSMKIVLRTRMFRQAVYFRLCVTLWQSHQYLFFFCEYVRLRASS